MTSELYGTYWQVVLASEPSISMIDKENSVLQPVSIDEIWWILALRVNKDNVIESFGHKMRRRKVKRNDDDDILVEFTDGQFKKIQFFINSKNITLEAVLRFSLFARTDLGIILVSYVPECSSEASPLVTCTCKNYETGAVLQNLATTWLFNIERN